MELTEWSACIATRNLLQGLTISWPIFRELYSEEHVFTYATIERTTSLSIMNELDAPPTIEDLREAIDSLTSSKAPGNDGVSFEVLKVGNYSSLPNHLYEPLLQSWEEGLVPRNLRDSDAFSSGRIQL